MVKELRYSTVCTSTCLNDLCVLCGGKLSIPLVFPRVMNQSKRGTNHALQSHHYNNPAPTAVANTIFGLKIFTNIFAS